MCRPSFKDFLLLPVFSLLLLSAACDYGGYSKANAWADGWLTGIPKEGDATYTPVYAPNGPT